MCGIIGYVGNENAIKVTIEDALMAEKMFKILMGENVEARKEFILNHARDVKNLDV